MKDLPEVTKIIKLWSIICSLEKENKGGKKPKKIIPHGSQTVIREEMRELKIKNPDLPTAKIILEAIQNVGKKKIKDMRLKEEDINNLLEKAREIYNKKNDLKK